MTRAWLLQRLEWYFCCFAVIFILVKIDRALTLSPKPTPSRFPTKSRRELKTFLYRQKNCQPFWLANENPFVVFIQNAVVIKTAVFWLEQSNNDEAGYFSTAARFFIAFSASCQSL
jgi:hypothetical protein